MVATLKHPEAAPRGPLLVNSFTATPLEMLKEFERQCGGKKWEVSYTPLSELRKLEKEAHDKIFALSTIYTLRRIWNEGGTLYEKRDNAKIDMENTETLAHAVKLAIEQQLSIL